MEFLKRQAFLLICGVVAVLAIVLGALKLNSMAHVKRDMQEAVSVATKFKSYKGSKAAPPVNRQAIEMERERVATTERHFQDILHRSLELTHYEPLVPKIFPAPTTDQRYEFAEAYVKAMARLLDPLHGGSPPSESDIALQRQIVIEMQKNQLPEGPAPQAAPPPMRTGGKGGPPAHQGPPGGPTPPPPPTGEGAVDPNTGLPKEEAARLNPAIRAAVKRALGILCYCSPKALDRNEHASDTVSPAKAAEMWEAQIGLWIQQDVIAALARVNDREADRIRKENGNPWVGLMPVKDFVSIRISPYVRSEAAADRQAGAPAVPLGDEPARPPGVATPFANANVSNDLFDVVQFTVKLVVDARDIPLIVDEICRNKFHRPLRIDYSEEPPNLSMTGKIYGSEPTARVVMDFETCFFFADEYAALMPDDTLAALAHQRPKPKVEGSASK